MAYKVDFDFQQGMRSLGRLSRRAYDKMKDLGEEAEGDAAPGESAPDKKDAPDKDKA